tara:strand:- start:1120 stop:1404 length:285 start_codon:yes stop_codon:yes gene_type:complete
MEKIHVTIRGNSMWPTLTEGQEILATKYYGQKIKVGQIIVFKHPFDNTLIAVKRVKAVDDGLLFVEGDNPDPTASNDSHNFGLLKQEFVIAIAV